MTRPWVDDLGVPVDVVVDGQDVEVAAGRVLWAGCSYCLNPRHPGPCAKPGSKAYVKRHGKAKKDGPSGGGGGAGPGGGKDVIGDGDGEEFALSVDSAVAGKPSLRGDNTMGEIAHRQGYDGKPEVLSSAEFDQRISEPGHTEMFRGINNGTDFGIRPSGKPPADLAEDFRTGKMFHGMGSYGNGTYAVAGSGAAGGAKKYAGPNGAVLRMALRPGSRTVDYNDISYEHEAFLGSRARSGAASAAYSDVGRYAAAKGYDAITRRVASGQSHYVVLNRTALLVEAAS